MKRNILCICMMIFLAAGLYQCSKCGREEKEGPEGEAPPQAVRAEPLIQEPIVAGGFYPSRPDDLRAMVEKYLEAAELKELRGKPFGFMVPHAGYIYSGPVAAYAYKLIGQSNIKRFVIMGPSHYAGGELASVLDKDFYRTPLGLVKIDRKKVKELISRKPWISYEPTFFTREHSLEVQLPFLQAVVGDDLEIVPVVIGTPRLELAQKFAVVLDEVFAGDDVIFLASSDMSHYFSYDVANRMDQLALSRILAMDVHRLEDDFRKNKAQCCGAGPIFALMSLFKMRGGHMVEVLDYKNSGDTAGNRNRVVGYGSVAFLLTGDEKPLGDEQEAKEELKLIPPEDYKLSLEEKKELMSIARHTVETYVQENRLPEVEVDSPKLREKGAAFVTLNKNGQLRGCIGHLVGRMPLYLCVREVAAQAARHDRRFRPVALEELPELEYEISVLTPMQEVKDLDEIMVGRDGLEMESGAHRGVLLPQVPVEYNWTRDEFLSHTCTKAGMAPDCWRTGDVKISRFQALVFSEEELEEDE
jgi:AmmeMemoRadiSam system protein B/AmmeMemoRadiSam system protein A